MSEWIVVVVVAAGGGGERIAAIVLVTIAVAAAVVVVVGVCSIEGDFIADTRRGGDAERWWWRERMTINLRFRRSN